MYGENYGTETLAQSLMTLAKGIKYGLNNGTPYEDMREDARNLVTGAMVLYERLVTDE